MASIAKQLGINRRTLRRRVREQQDENAKWLTER